MLYYRIGHFFTELYWHSIQSQCASGIILRHYSDREILIIDMSVDSLRLLLINIIHISAHKKHYRYILRLGNHQMDIEDTKSRCKLCNEITNETIGIFSEQGVRLKVASILAKHFLFLQVCILRMK